MRREIANAKNFIDNHYMENLTLDQIATKSYLSKYHLIRSSTITSE
jgi:AraC-like DNA-binding protein